jgi:uncharacterized protein YbaP (TraB family)
MKRLAAALLLLFAFTGAAAADSPVPHPALWKVQGKACTVYLFGSVHILSPSLVWRDARVDEAIAKADSFFFETSLDTDAIKSYIAAKGSLPPGQSLRTLLPPDAQKNLDDDFAALGVPEAAIDTRRPWLATLAMIGIKYAKGGAPSGADIAILADAKARNKPLRYFETPEQQLALLAPDDPKVELQSFEMFLKDFKKDESDIGRLVDAWVRGDEQRLAQLLLKELEKYPDTRKVIFDDRNMAWAKTLEGVLDHESGTVFVTVGAGHLLTANGVPALLSRDGYTVTTL